MLSYVGHLGFSLAARGFTDITVVLADPQLASLLPTLELPGGLPFCLQYDLESIPSHNGPSPWAVVGIQGSPSFCSSLHLRFSGCCTTLVLVKDMVSRRAPGAVVSHANVGGVTNGRYKVHLLGDATLPLGWNKSLVERRLGYILRSTESGITSGDPSSSCRKCSSAGIRVYTPSMRINTGCAGVDVILPSVFSKSGFVRRQLTPSELMDAYNVQVDIGKAVATSPSVSLLVDSLVASPLEKVTSALVRHIQWALPSASLTQGPLPPPSSSTQNGIQWLVDEDNRVLNDEKAARNDDWAPDTSQWNTYIVSNYDPGLEWHDFHAANTAFCSSRWLAVDQLGSLSSSSPLVCTGGPVSDAHLRLFTGLQHLMLRRYRRNLLQSFLRYLRAVHGTDWSARHQGRLGLFNGLNTLPLSKGKRGRNRGPLSSLSNSQLCSHNDLHLDIHIDFFIPRMG